MRRVVFASFARQRRPSHRDQFKKPLKCFGGSKNDAWNFLLIRALTEITISTAERLRSAGWRAMLSMHHSGTMGQLYTEFRKILKGRIGMGGYGSGRSGGWPTVEDSFSLNLPRLFKMGWLKPGVWTSGTLRWSIVGTGEETASIGFEARLGGEDGHVRLHWTSTNQWSGEKRQCENRIELTTRPQPLGGLRWWFVCPLAGQLAERLHLPSGAYTFACRKAYRLAYRSQRETPRDRALSRAFSLRHKLGDDGAIGDCIIKPKGMHRRTFERAMGRINRAEDIVDGHAVLLLDRLNRVASR